VPSYDSRGVPMNDAAKKEEAERIKAENAAAAAPAGS
jgi:hypothetical protein